MIDIICQYNAFRILSALVIGANILFGLVLGYQIGKAKERRSRMGYKEGCEDAK